MKHKCVADHHQQRSDVSWAIPGKKGSDSLNLLKTRGETTKIFIVPERVVDMTKKGCEEGSLQEQHGKARGHSGPMHKGKGCYRDRN